MAAQTAKKKSNKRNNTKRARPLQYSKKMATFVCAAWCLFRIAALVAMVYKPSAAGEINKWVGGVDTVMFANIGFYSGNSVSEKFILKHYETKEQEKDEEEYSENG